GQEGDRHEDGGQGHGRRNHREEHLLGAEYGGGAWAEAHGAAAGDVLEHHDGVVDDEPGGDDEGQQGQDVEGESEEIDSGDGADQCHRHGHRGDDGCPPVEQEQEDDGDHPENGDQQRTLHLLDGTLDEDGIVARDLEVDAGGQTATQVLDCLL